MAEIEERVAQYRDGAYQKILFVVIPDRTLKPHNTFECQLVIPGTQFSDTKKTVYSPSKELKSLYSCTVKNIPIP